MSKIEYDGPSLEIENLSISFFTRLREIPAVMDFSVTVQPGEAVGLVGESDVVNPRLPWALCRIWCEWPHCRRFDQIQRP